MEEERAVVVQDPHHFGLTVTRDPNAVLAEAHRAAKALKDLIESKPKEKKVMMNGEQYLEFEDWQTVGKFYGVTAKVVETKYIEINGVRGYEARAVAYHAATGQEVSAAESMCLNDEEKWSTRSKYEWKDGKREKVGDVAVPLFQLKSMAQTRACAKVLRNVLAWVVVLAGYKPAVAEEMTGDEEPGEPAKPSINPPQKKSAPAAQTSKPAAAASTDGESFRFVPAKYETKAGGTEEEPWLKHSIKGPDGNWYATFKEEIGEVLAQATEQKREIIGKYTVKGQYKTIVEAALV